MKKYYIVVSVCRARDAYFDLGGQSVGCQYKSTKNPFE